MKSNHYAILFIVLLSCSGQKSQDEKTVNTSLPYSIDIESNFDNHKKINLSEIADSIQYIELKTSSKCLLSYIKELKLTADYIFVADKNGVYQFSRKGNFIRQIGENGRGPGEYPDVRTFTIDEKQKLLYISGFWNRVIGVYNFEGDFLYDFKIEPLAENFNIYDSTTLACSLPCSGADQNEFNLYLIDSKSGNIIKKYPDYYNIKGMHAFNYATLIRNKNKLYYNDTFADSMFIVDEAKRQVPYCIFNFGKYKILETQTMPASVSVIQRIFPMDNFILFLYMSPVKDNYARLGFFDTKTMELFNVSPTGKNSGFPAFYNDFDGLAHFAPKYLGENGELIRYIEMLDLHKGLEFCIENNIPQIHNDEKVYMQISSIIKNKSIEDNGIVMITYPKK